MATDEEQSRVRPAYDGGSLVNLMGTLEAALGGPGTDYPRLASMLSAGELGAARKVVLLVIDGMGYHYLLGRGPGSHLHQDLRGALTSVFPSTTASAISTFLTGVAPQQHAITGWFMYLRGLGMVTTILPFRSRAGGLDLAAAGFDPRRVLGAAPVFDRLPVCSQILLPHSIVDSAYSRAGAGRGMRHGYASLDALFTSLLQRLREPDPGFTYAYWPDFDRRAHVHGVDSVAVHEHFAEIDAAYARLVAQAQGSDALLIVTADHGFVDVEPEDYVELDDHPVLQRCLALPLCGEPRVAYCYVRPGEQTRFQDYVNEHLAHACTLYESRALVAQGWFGCGPPHPALAERVGDYAMLTKARYVIKDSVSGERPFRPRGVHGGTSPEEMRVPLIVRPL